MKKSELLFDLIQSLTQSEKRFFKIYASRHTIGEQNNYVKLFECIDKMSSYDEEKLLKKIQKEAFAKNLPAEKNYLYHMILECLDIYHKDSSVERQISKLINIARVLSEKKLDDQSNKIIEKAKILSEEHERFENLITIFTLQKNIGFNQDNISTRELETNYQHISSNINRLKAKMDYQQLFDRLLLQRRLTGPIRNAEELGMLKSTYETAFSQPPLQVQSLDAQLYFLLARVEYARIARDIEQTRKYTKELFRLFKENEQRIDHHILPYVYLLNIFIVQRLYTSRKEANTALSKLDSVAKQISPKAFTNEVKVKIWEIYYTCLTDIAIEFKDYGSVLSRMDDIHNGLKEYERHMTPSFKLVLWSNIACVYFGAGNYKQALKWSHEVVNDAPTYREDIFYITRILYVLIHLELGNQLILPNLLQSLYRYLYKKNRVYQFESIFFKYLRLFLRTDTKKDLQKLLQEFKEELLPLQNNSFENLIFGDIDLIGWIDRKLKE
jgi:hypothetical protein